MSAMSKTRLLAALLLLAGCGKEVGRIPFAAEGSSRVSAALDAGKVAFWTDVDLDYEGSATLDYQVALIQHGTRVATAACNALGPIRTKLLWVESERGSARSRRGLGRMECSATLPKGGPTTVEASLAFGVRPLAATIRRADLVVKQ